MAPLILRLDITGQPLRWIPWREAVLLDFKSMIAWNAGDQSFTFRGGYNRLSGKRSSITVSSIIAVIPQVLVEVLRQLGVVDRDDRDLWNALEEIAQPTERNFRGRKVGTYRPVFRLQRGPH